MSSDSPIVHSLKGYPSSDHSTTLHAHLCQLLTSLPSPADQLNGLAHL